MKRGAKYRDRAKGTVHEVVEVVDGRRGKVVRTRSERGEVQIREERSFEGAFAPQAGLSSRPASEAYRRGWERVFARGR